MICSKGNGKPSNFSTGDSYNVSSSCAKQTPCVLSVRALHGSTKPLVLARCPKPEEIRISGSGELSMSSNVYTYRLRSFLTDCRKKKNITRFLTNGNV